MKVFLTLLLLGSFLFANVDNNLTVEDKQEIKDFQDLNMGEDSYKVDGCHC